MKGRHGTFLPYRRHEPTDHPGPAALRLAVASGPSSARRLRPRRFGGPDPFMRGLRVVFALLAVFAAAYIKADSGGGPTAVVCWGLGAGAFFWFMTGRD